MLKCQSPTWFTITERLRSVFSFAFSYINEQPSYTSFSITGKGADKVFLNEAGVHRFQRVPPNERRGRTHTSSITVACLSEGLDRSSGVSIKSKDLDYSFYRSHGPGGQHKNKTYSAVRLKHISSGIVVHAQFGRSQNKNKETALKILKAKLAQNKQEEIRENKNRKRKEQVGRGARGDKIRTYCVKKDLVVDHRNGRRMSFKRFARGFIKDIHSQEQCYAGR